MLFPITGKAVSCVTPLGGTTWILESGLLWAWPQALSPGLIDSVTFAVKHIISDTENLLANQAVWGCSGGGPSTVINSFYPVVQQAMNVIEYHFQKSEPLLHSLSLSQPAVERAVYDLIMILSTQLFSLEMVWNLSIFDFLAPFIRFLFGKGRHKVMTCPCSCATPCPPGGHLDT